MGYWFLRRFLLKEFTVKSVWEIVYFSFFSDINNAYGYIKCFDKFCSGEYFFGLVKLLIFRMILV